MDAFGCSNLETHLPILKTLVAKWHWRPMYKISGEEFMFRAAATSLMRQMLSKKASLSKNPKKSSGLPALEVGYLSFS